MCKHITLYCGIFTPPENHFFLHTKNAFSRFILEIVVSEVILVEQSFAFSSLDFTLDLQNIYSYAIVPGNLT